MGGSKNRFEFTDEALARGRLKTGTVDTPECNKIQEVKGQSHIIGEFMDWLRDEKGWTICVRHEHDDDCYTRVQLSEDDDEGEMQRICDCRNGDFIPVPLQMEQLLAEFFEIDLNKVEQERSQLLDLQRAMNTFHAHLDGCEQCREHPMDLCPTGLPLLHAAGGRRFMGDAVEACPHGEPLGECNACDVAGDLAFDADREDGCR